MTTLVILLIIFGFCLGGTKFLGRLFGLAFGAIIGAVLAIIILLKIIGAY